MAALFHRQYGPSLWDQNALAGPMEGLTLREWEVSVILCSQQPQIKRALCAWLIAPTAPNWPRPDTFTRHLLPFTESDLRSQAGQAEGPTTRLWDVIKAIRQTLDMPYESLHGIARDLLLVTHGTRLRQVVAALGEAAALAEIDAMLRLAGPARTSPPVFLSTRWGGRWSAFFAGAGGVAGE